MASVIDLGAHRRPSVAIDRSSDRLVALSGIGLALLFITAALVTTALPSAFRLGLWLPLHLALAGAAGCAIAGVMPFFAAAFAAAPPTDARLRFTALGAVATGALAASLGVSGRVPALSVAGGAAFVAGIMLTGIATVRPLGRGLGPSRGIVTKGYLIGLAEVAVGVTLSTVFLAGWPPLVDVWARLKPAHAWLNLIGFVSLVIATTLLHFFPTVIGARIARHPTAQMTIAGLAAGPPLVALGLTLRSDALAQAGAIAALAGSIALGAYAWRAWRRRAHWSTDREWHAFAMGGIISGLVWFQLGMLIAASRVLVSGAGPGSWSIEAVAGPLVIGWIGLTLVASATHLVPAVGPGDLAAHAEQRRLLGRGALLRLAAGNVGTLALSIGLPSGTPWLSAAGLVLIAIGLGSTALLIAFAVLIGLRGVMGARGPRATR